MGARWVWSAPKSECTPDPPHPPRECTRPTQPPHLDPPRDPLNPHLDPLNPRASIDLPAARSAAEKKQRQGGEEVVRRASFGLGYAWWRTGDDGCPR